MNPRRGACPAAAALAAALVAGTLAAAPADAQPAPDRYGATYAPAAAPQDVASLNAASLAAASLGVTGEAAPVRLRTRFLTWPGKVTRDAATAAPSAGSQPSAIQSRAAPPPSYDRSGRRDAGRRLWNPGPAVSPRADPVEPAVYGSARGGYARSAQPRSIYDAPPAQAPTSAYRPYPWPSPAAAAPVRRQPYPAPAYPMSAAETADPAAPPLAGQPTASAYPAPPNGRTASQGVRFYSLHRPFGLAPDPAPIPPQFFAATPDLGDPPGPNPNRRVAGVGSAAARAAQTANQGADQTAGGDPAAQP